ncbi:MAG: hypothetical protein ABS36_15625 [Acidobacteria bacterium SCN 69-37]|nr:MAG: hypothetical protein ABS36_15625 [Acidobacteria bacterium SCN 69-37]
MVIKRIGPMSAAKIAGVIYAVFGLLFGALVSLFAVGGAMFMPEAQRGPFGVLFGIAAIVLLPLCYGVLGFVSAFVATLIFNAAANAVGGVELEVE